MKLTYFMKTRIIKMLPNLHFQKWLNVKLLKNKKNGYQSISKKEIVLKDLVRRI